MAGILLVHGGWHGPWCWDAFAAHLEGDHQHLHATRLLAPDLLVVQGAAVGPGIDLGLHTRYPQPRQGDVFKSADGGLGAGGHGCSKVGKATGEGRIAASEFSGGAC